MQKIIVLLAASIITLIAFKSPTQFIIRGKITDNKGQPLSGVSINIRETKMGTASAADGVSSPFLVHFKSRIIVSLFSCLVVPAVGRSGAKA